MVLILAGFGAADYFLIQSSRFVSALLRSELRRTFGDSLAFGSARLTNRDTIEVDAVSLRTAPAGPIFLECPRVEMRVKGRRVEEVVIRDGRIHLTREVQDVLRHGAADWARSGRLPEALPRVRMPSATVRIARADGTQQEAEVSEATLTPAPEGGLWIHARVRDAQGQQWSLAGRSGFDRPFEVRLLRADVPMEEVRPWFGPAADAMWERQRPEGTVDVEVVVTGDEPELPRIAAILKDGAFSFRGLRVRHLAGRVEFRDGIAACLETARGEAATDFGGRLSLRYRAEGLHGGAAWRLRFDMEDFPLEEVPRALPEKVLETWAKYDPRGRADFSGEASGTMGREEHDVRVEARFADAGFDIPAFGRVEAMEGVAEYRGDTLNIWRLERRPGAGSAVSVSARVDGLRYGPARVRAEFACLDLPFRRFAELARDAFPMDELFCGLDGKPLDDDAGTVELRCLIEDGAQTIRVRLNGNRAVYRRFPLPLEDIRGEIVLREDRVEFERIQARPAGFRTPEGTFPEVRIRGYVQTRGDTRLTEFCIEARDFPVQERLIEALPASIRSMVEFVHLRGRAQVTANIATRDGGRPRTAFVVGLDLSDGSLDPGVRMEDVNGTIFVDGVTEGARTTITGHLRFPRAVVAGHPFTNLSADFALGERSATFHGVRADLYGGMLRGDVLLDLDARTFRASLAGDGLRLEEYALAQRRYSEQALSGEMDVEVEEWTGSLDDPQSFRGRGRIRIEDGFVWGIPVFVRLLDLDIGRVLATGPREMTGEIRFAIADGAFRVERMVLSDETLAVFGRGKVRFDGQMHLILKTFPNYGVDLPGLDILKTLFNELRGQVYAWEATGPFDDPRLSWRLFPSLTAGDDD